MNMKKFIYKAYVTLFVMLAVFVMVPAAWATTYYVDATNGNNTNGGTSPSTAWKTIAKVNSSSFNPGDSILFKREQMWREKLIVPSSGSVGNPITFGAYGAGGDPIINGADLVTSWTLYSGNIYNAITSGRQRWTNSLWEDDKLLWKESFLADVNAPGEFYNDSSASLIYVWATNGTDPDTHKMEVAARTSVIYLDTKSYIRFQNLTLEKDSGRGTALLDGLGATNIVASNLTIRRSGHGASGVRFRRGDSNVIEDNEFYEIGNTAVNIWDNEKNVIVRRNHIHDTGNTLFPVDRGGIMIGPDAPNALVEFNNLYNIGPPSMTGTSLISPIAIDRSNNCIVRYNIMHHNVKGGIVVGGGSATGDGHVNGVKVYYNLIYDHNPNGVVTGGAAGGIHFQNVNNAEVYNNVIWNFNSAGGLLAAPIVTYNFGGGAQDNTIIKNNIIGPATGPNRQHIRFRFGGNFTNFVSNNNLFFDGSGLVLIDSGTTYTSLAAYQAATSLDRNSVEANPLFVDTENANFRLQSTSPAISTGSDVGLTQDYGGTPVPQGIGVDIGAFEFVYDETLAPAAPKNLRIIDVN